MVTTSTTFDNTFDTSTTKHHGSTRGGGDRGKAEEGRTSTISYTPEPKPSSTAKDQPSSEEMGRESPIISQKQGIGW
jgi:hypothetical protein